MTIGEVIKTLRQAAGYSQKGFAQLLKISPSYLSSLESDKKDASLQLLRDMARVLGAPATVLFAAALGSRLALEGKTDELEVISKLVDVVRLNLTQEGLPFAVQAPE